MSKYVPTIGIEIHVQLATKSKMFCSCDNDSVRAEPNTNVCPVCLGYPGTLPVPNKHAVELAIRLGYGLHATVREHTKFDRKNYFYPDSPKGYQITQFDQPIIEDGWIEILIDGEFKRIGIERAHLEEDAGKLSHPAGKDYSLVDLNRAGTPLLEIVSRPDMHTPQEARRYLQEIYAIATTLGVTHGDMQHGNMKFDLNVSISDDPEKLGTRTELKNLNSFRNAERALTHEIARQIEIREAGGAITQETRGWDDSKGQTFSQRSKEEAHDYRYFPEPDIPPLVVTEEMRVAQREHLGTLPIDLRRELVEIGLNIDEQDVLIGQPHTSAIFAEAREAENEKSTRKVLNYLIGPYQAYLKSQSTEEVDLTQLKPKYSAAQLMTLVGKELNGELSSNMAKQVFVEMCEQGADPEEIIEREGMTQLSDEAALQEIVERVIQDNPQAVADFKSGNEKALGFFVGQIMKETKGQANPQTVNALLHTMLKTA